MHASTIFASLNAVMAFLAAPVVGLPSNDIEARSAELDTRSAQIEARAAALVCQFTGVKGCSAECIAKGHLHGGYCNSHQTCVCNSDN